MAEPWTRETLKSHLDNFFDSDDGYKKVIQESFEALMATKHEYIEHHEAIQYTREVLGLLNELSMFRTQLAICSDAKLEEYVVYYEEELAPAAVANGSEGFVQYFCDD
jgi:hypothetical protein